MNTREEKSVPPKRLQGRQQALMPELVRVRSRVFAKLAKGYPKVVQSQYSLRDCLLLFMATFLFKSPSSNQFLAVLDPDLAKHSARCSKQQTVCPSPAESTNVI